MSTVRDSLLGTPFDTPRPGSLAGDIGLRTLPQVHLAVVQVVVIAVVTVLHVAHLGVEDGVVAVAVVALVAGLMLPRSYAALTGVASWAWLTGFVVNTGAHDGQLSLGVPDLARLALLLALALVGSLLARRSTRHSTGVRPRVRPRVRPGEWDLPRSATVGPRPRHSGARGPSRDRRVTRRRAAGLVTDPVSPPGRPLR